MAKSIEIILRRRVEDLGDVGDVVNVKAGYARNYLLPQGLAYRASEESRRLLGQERAAALMAEDRARDTARAVSERLDGTSITFSMLAGEEGKLYGSVGPRDIAAQLSEHGFDIHGRHVIMKDTIKALGVYSVPVRVHPDVEVSVKVWVIKEEEE